MVLRKQMIRSNCPRCNLPKEDTTYVLRYWSADICSLRSSLSVELGIWLNSVDTHPDITSFLYNGISSWLTSSPFGFNKSIAPDLLIAMKSQLLLGWEALLHRFITRKLVTCQHDYYIHTESRKSGKRWCSNLITHLWNIVYQHWVHRNNIFHKLLSGVELLQETIASEYAIGLDTLPYIYCSYFLEPLPAIILKSTSYLKHWFLVV